MHYPLRQLEAELEVVFGVTTTEIETEEGNCKGQYVFRDSDGKRFMWGPKPIRYEFHNTDDLARADHIQFLCPKCFEKNGGPAGTHRIMVSFANRAIPDDVGSRDADGKPSRWVVQSGTSLDDLVLTPSILLDAKRKPEVGCHWHGFVGSSGIPPGHAG